MNVLELLKEHPLTTSVLQKWFMDKFLESLKDERVPEEYKEQAKQNAEQNIKDESIATFIEGNPHMLLEIFDSYDIYVEVFRVDQKFTTSVNGEQSTERYSDRIDAEREAIIHCFTILETKLKPTEDGKADESRDKEVEVPGDTGQAQ